MKILASDVGGTKTILQLFEVSGGERRVLGEAQYPSNDFPTLSALVRQFLATAGRAADRACFGVPGPVHDGKANITNLPWRLDAQVLAAECGIGQVQIINDFAAVGYGITELGPEDLVSLNAGAAEPHGTIAVLGAGTGLGEASLHWAGQHYAVSPSEGGHTDFGPRNEREIGLLRYLMGRYGHVSYERIVSGPGLVHIYEYLRGDGAVAESAAVHAAMAAGDPGAAIAQGAAAGDRLSLQAVEMFVSVYGAEAGNVALKHLATGGVYVAGGVGRHLATWLQAGGFRHAFLDKGRFAALLEGIPVWLVMNAKVGLLGAAAVAARLN